MVVGGLVNGTTYDFDVRAVSNTDAKGNHGSASATPSTVPGAPTLTATGDYKRIKLDWTASTDNGGAAITSFRIERQDNGIWGNPRMFPGSATTWTASVLSNGTEYTYRIFAINVAGDSGWTSATALTLAHQPKAPDPPVLPGTGSVTPGPGSLTYTWEPPNFNGGAPITRYEYQYKPTDSSSWSSGRTDDGETLSVELENLNPAKTYDFEVSARNSAGLGDELEIPEGSPSATAPTAAPTISAIASEDASNNADLVTLTWTKLDDARNGGATLDGYLINWKDNREMTAWQTDLTAVTYNVATVVYTFPHTGRSPGTIYTYRVRAQNGVGDGGPWSAEVSATTPANMPDMIAAPPEVSGADVDAILVDWDEPQSDGGSAITGYELQVRTGTEQFVDADDTIIDSLPGNRTDYTHRGVRGGVDYFYRVRAINAAGMGGWSGRFYGWVNIYGRTRYA